jgi:hypothetical protein
MKQRLLHDRGEVELLDARTYWLVRAIEARVVAYQLQDPIARSIMLNVAESYEQIADDDR